MEKNSTNPNHMFDFWPNILHSERMEVGQKMVVFPALILKYRAIHVIIFDLNGSTLVFVRCDSLFPSQRKTFIVKIYGTGIKSLTIKSNQNDGISRRNKSIQANINLLIAMKTTSPYPHPLKGVGEGQMGEGTCQLLILGLDWIWKCLPWLANKFLMQIFLWILAVKHLW